MNLSDLDYEYPDELIAYHPSSQRSDSKMMVLDRMNQSYSHQNFSSILEYINQGDVLILNNSKVFPCRLISQRKTGGKIECLLLRDLGSKIWECLMKSSKKIHWGEEIDFSPELKGKIIQEEGLIKKIQLQCDKDLMEVLHEVAHIPLPPYIKREANQDDLKTYQTVYAENTGSVAAPTAGLHFTDEILEKFKQKGIGVGYLSLHVGMGTFTPIRVENLEDHQMHGEYYEIPSSTVEMIHQAKSNGKRVIAVGTTSVRALESAVISERGFQAGMNYTEHFIYPPYKFKMIDGMLTNFHQPRTSLLALVSAFTSKDFILRAYEEAIEQKYRLFSYGDCMLIL